MMYKKSLILSAIVILSSSFLFAVPQRINYQGKLLENGVPVNGDKQMIFKIFDASIGGNELWSSGVTLAIDTNYEINERDIKVSFGTEWSPVGFLSLRGGYFLNLLKDTSQSQNKPFSEPDKGLGGGLGINILNYSIDYAVVPYSDLGTTQRISFIAKF